MTNNLLSAFDAASNGREVDRAPTPMKYLPPRAPPAVAQARARDDAAIDHSGARSLLSELQDVEMEQDEDAVPNVLLMPKPAGVPMEVCVQAVSSFIAQNCTVYPNPAPDADFEKNMYVATAVQDDQDYVAVINHRGQMPVEDSKALALFMRTAKLYRVP